MSKKILIVDDEIEILETLKDYLTEEGFDVLLAKNREEFFNHAQNTPPDLIILDIVIGPENGPQMYNELVHKGFDPEIPVIFLSGLLEDRPPSYSYEGRKTSLLGKPFDPKKLVEEINNLIK